MIEAHVRDHLDRRLPGLQPGQPVALKGGLLNRVWRVPTGAGSVVVKHAPARVGALELDPHRITIEAAALADPPGGFCTSGVRAPRLLDFDPSTATVVMEDAGELPALDVWLKGAHQAEAHVRGNRLGSALAALHRVTDSRSAERFDNRPIQQTRLDVQYRSVGASLQAAGVDGADALGRRAVELGIRLLGPGRCVVMGDLWPRSVHVGPETLWLIDWEMAHFGQPFQDYAHLAAHLWMLRHAGIGAASTFGQAFAEAYFGAAPPEIAGEAQEAAFHAGCEIVVRALGPFREGYVYEAASKSAIREAVAQAVRWLRGGVHSRADLFRPG